MENNTAQLLKQASIQIEHKASSYSPLALAYIGDAVYEIFARTYIMGRGNMPVNKLHKAVKNLVKAQTQSKIYYILEDVLCEEEKDILKRGRNAKSMSSPKNGDILDYRRATAVEALIGYLYIHGDIQRLEQLMTAAITQLIKEEE
jgi:ribonuclease-3 family protein